ncbi:MAG: hypothetical protein JWM31_1391 [Solirubrobacterales bacterium]|nr:hypothetical protein [Solirubrobacterales bacterium]
MFPPTEDQSRSPRPWRAALRGAAELVVAFATLDSYPLNRTPDDSSDGDALLAELDIFHGAARDPHGRAARLEGAARGRGHGRPPVRAVLCLHHHVLSTELAPVPARTDDGTRKLSRHI